MATDMALIEALHVDGPAADRAEAMGLYGWLIGEWVMDATVRVDGGGEHRGKGRVAFGWVLEGRAIQDVWVLPGLFHGTTLRIYDPAIDAWHILWSDPLSKVHLRQLGRRLGDDIVQEGRDDAGQLTRWSFTEITPVSFRWLGEESSDDGATWETQMAVRAHRIIQAGAP